MVAGIEQGKEPLSDFRMADKDPFPRAINVGAAKCRQASKTLADSTTQPPRDLYVAFISIPSGAQVEGSLLYRARTASKSEVFFSAPTQKYQAFESDKLTRVLAVLSECFKELVLPILGKNHVLAVKLQEILKRKAEIEFWNATQQKVKDLIQKGQAEHALAVLEPLVFCATPHAQAEKLLGELLLSSATKQETAASGGPSQDALKGLTTETLLIQWLLKRIG